MAFNHVNQQIFLSSAFEHQARQVFQIPVYHYITNDELEYYFSILKDPLTHDEARTARVLLCTTRVDCPCYACQQNPEEPDSLELSHLTEGGNDADDEYDTTLEEGPSGSSALDTRSSWGSCSDTLHSQSSTSVHSSLLDSSVEGSTTGNTCSTCPPATDTSRSVIVLTSGTDEEQEVIIISDDEQDKTAIPSPPLATLHNLWNSTFRSDGGDTDTLSWDSPQPRKKIRRGLNYADPFQGHPKDNKPRKWLLKVSPISKHSSPCVWANKDNSDRNLTTNE